MSNINSDYTDNYGGLRVIKYAIAQEIKDLIDFYTLWQDPETLDVPQNVLDENFHDITPIIETASHLAPTELSNQGKQCNPTIQLRLRKDRSEIRTQLERVINKGLILYIEDRNGVHKLVGTPEAPMRQNEDYLSGMKVMDTNGYTYYFNGQSPHYKVPLVNII